MYDVVELNRNKKKLYSCSNNHLIPMNMRVRPRKNGIRNNADRYWHVKNYEASYLSNLSKHTKKNMTTLLSPPINEFMNKKNCEIEPYTFGIWMGDGHFSSKECESRNTKYGNELIRLDGNGNKRISKEPPTRTQIHKQIGITTMDKPIIDEIKKHYDIMSVSQKENNQASTYIFSIGSKLSKQLQSIGMEGKGSGTKFIPDEVFTSDIEYRRKFLAGLLDSDGYYDNDSSSYEITIKSEALANGIYRLARSLGYRGSLYPKKRSIKSIGFTGDYFHVNFYVGENKLPVLLDRKSGNNSTFYLSSDRTSIDVVPSKSQMVYGFELDSESSLYITEDYVVTHNSGKSTFAFQQAKYIDPTFNNDRICFTPEHFLDQIRTAKPGQVVVFDEAFRGFSSKASQSKVNKTLVQAMMEVRRRNLIIFIVIPSLILLENYIVVHRSNAIFFVYKRNDKTAKYRGWKAYSRNKSAIIYHKAKKNYGIIPKIATSMNGKFFAKTVDVDGVKMRLPYETFDEIGYDNKKGIAFGDKKAAQLEDPHYEELWRIKMAISNLKKTKGHPITKKSMAAALDVSESTLRGWKTHDKDDKTTETSDK
jgi:hypothetical protein